MGTKEEDLVGGTELSENPLSEVVIRESYKNEQDNLQKIALTEEHLAQIKENLSKIIDILSRNRSLVTKAADYWGGLSLWQKLVGGAVLTVPTLAAGIAAQLGALLALSGATVAVYTTGSIILDDHHNYNKNITEDLKKGVFSLADILAITISALDNIRVGLSKELEKFKEQNSKLAGNIALLNDKLETLSNQVEVFVFTEKLLRETQEKLEQEAERLRQTAVENEELLKKNELELLQVRKDYDKSRQQLNEKVTELVNVKTSMEIEVKKAKDVSITLQNTVKTLSNAVIDDNNQREVFQKKIATIINDNEQNALLINTRVQELEKELREVKEQLELSNNRYRDLLDRQESQIERLERIGVKDLKLKHPPEEHAEVESLPIPGPSVLMNNTLTPKGEIGAQEETGVLKHGLYAKKNKLITAEPTFENTSALIK
ncbi:inclusion membrane protein A [Legionella busanensis]|uniref:Inclusion membrane protein A n=1 Tax=Legionella busanensis TaxID=190655 RepID=A0A378JK53_9GAMM|nr:LegC2/C7 family Dot/Icm T4SS effector [Legionella busanensis]STX50599.1 inclusion membrane protein A [Legionella busanensis]